MILIIISLVIEVFVAAMCAAAAYQFYPIAASIMEPFSGSQWLFGMTMLMLVVYLAIHKVGVFALTAGAFLGDLYRGLKGLPMFPEDIPSALARHVDQTGVDGHSVGRRFNETKEVDYGY